MLEANPIGRTHGAPYRSYGYVPLRFEGWDVARRMGTHQQQQANSVRLSIVNPMGRETNISSLRVSSLFVHSYSCTLKGKEIVMYTKML